MIKSFRCKHTEALYRGRPTKPFRAFQAVAERKLQMLDIARRIDDLRIPPAKRLEAFWMGLQTAFDLKTAAKNSGEKIEAEISPRAA
jgi:plasmid maintenance system killer protein